MMKIIPAKTIQQLQTIESLAREILPEHYSPQIPLENILYFIEKFQTVNALKGQVREGFEYYLLNRPGKPVGYLGIGVKGHLDLSKLYILKQFRGMGIGDKAMAFVEERAMAASLPRIELIVNKYNSETIRFYEKRGFTITESFVHNYDDKYAVEEYRMTKILNPSLR